ncbi:MAG: hypothetical protein WBM14_12395 [Terracidiphilus sp.]|jgi:hypothetical protein
MSLVDTIARDSYTSALGDRAQIALTFFDGLVHNLESDLQMAENYRAQNSEADSFCSAFDGLEIRIAVERAEAVHKPSSLTISSLYAKIRIVANHPPGWLFIEISKQSAFFEGVLHYGVIEVVLHPRGDRPYELNLTRCGWLWLEGMPEKEKIRPRLIAELLWKHLLNPEIQTQLEELNQRAER